MPTDIQNLLAKHPGLVHRARFASMRFDIRSSAQRLRVEVDGPRIHASLAIEDSSIAAAMRKDAAEYARVIKAANIKLE